jgi:FtsH-binding integral membrane protein
MREPMSKDKTRSPVWKSPFKMGLLVLSALAYASACLFETRLPGDSEWSSCYLIIFIGSFLAALFEPERFLETAAMPFFAVLVLGFAGLGGPFFLVTMIFVLTTSVPAALIGSVARRVGNRIAGRTRRNRATHNLTPDGNYQAEHGAPKPPV